MLPFPTNFVDQPESIKADSLSNDGLQSLKELEIKGYEVRVGLSDDYSDTISRVCQQAAILEYCPNDIAKRFHDHTVTAVWLTGGRVVYLLVPSGSKDPNQLAGYGWIGPKKSVYVPEGAVTFGVRISEDHQGKGLAAPFSKVMLAAAASYSTGIVWLETWQSNVSAVHVYHKIGFVDVTQKADKRLTRTGSIVDDVRIYMVRK
jgi:ribosomal protein S18 acetylase RimI-like enzyme